MYTASYRATMERLLKSLQGLGLPHVLFEVPTVHRSISPKGTPAPAYTKANFIWHVRSKAGRPVLYLDCDTVVRHPPELIARCLSEGFDFAILNWLALDANDAYLPLPAGATSGNSKLPDNRYFRFSHSIPLYDPTQLVCSGAAQLWGTSEAASALLGAWHEAILSHPGVADDQCLDFAFNNLSDDWRARIRPAWLPKSYARYAWWILDEPVIDHPDFPYAGSDWVTIADKPECKRIYVERMQQRRSIPLIPHDAFIDTWTGDLFRMQDSQSVKVGNITQKFWTPGVADRQAERSGQTEVANGSVATAAGAPKSSDEQRRNMEALARMQEILVADPTCIDAALMLAYLAARLGSSQFFTKAVEMAWKVSPQDPRVAVLARNPTRIPVVSDARVLRAALTFANTPEALASFLPVLRETLPLLVSDGGLPLETLLAVAPLAERNDDRELLGMVARAAYEKAPDDLRTLLLAAKTNVVADVRVLQEARKRHPTSAPLCMQIALTLRKSGRLLEGLDLQRRMFGCTSPVPIVNPSKRRVRVGFLMQHPQGWTGFESVWRSMRDDPAFETTVFAAPYNHPYAPEGGRDAVYPFLEKEGVPFVRWDAAPLTPGFVDVLFVQNPYDITRPEPLRTPNLLKHVARLAYIPYGLEIGGGGENAANQFNQMLQQTAWAWFARSPRHRDMIVRHCDAGGTHVVVTGHPRMDMYRDLGKLPPDPEFTAFANGRRLVFWNPQFDIRPNNTGYSTFLIWQEFFLEEFARRQDVAFVIRPHPLFFGTLESRKIWTRAQVDDFLHRVEKAGNVLIDRRSSYLPVFAASDAMISDASSFLLEYGATGRPLLYLHNQNGPSLNEDGEFVRAHNYNALSREDVSSFITMVAEGRDPLGPGRQASFGEVMTCPPDGVAQAVKTHILTQLAQESRQLCR